MHSINYNVKLLERANAPVARQYFGAIERKRVRQ